MQLLGEETVGRLEAEAVEDPCENELSGGELSQAAQVTIRLCESRLNRQIRLPLMS